MRELEEHLEKDRKHCDELLEEQDIMLYKGAMTPEEHKVTCDAIVAEYKAHIAGIIAIH